MSGAYDLERTPLDALLYMLLSILLYSLFPLIGVFGTAQISGFTFAGLGHVLSAIVSLAGAVALSRRLGGYGIRALVADLRADRRALSQAVQSGVVNYLSHAFLFVSFVFISKAAATVIFEAWPVLAVYLLAILAHTRAGPKPAAVLDGRVFFLSVVAFLGLVIIVAGNPQNGDATGGLLQALNSRDGQIGLALAALSAVCMAYSVALGRNTRLYVEDRYGACETGADEVNRALLASAATKVFGALGFLATIPFLPDFGGEILTMSGETWGWVLFNGVVIVTLGSLSYREALARSQRLELAILWYTTPVVALAWLWLAGVETLTLSVGVGATLIVSANALLHMRADTSPAFVGVFLGVGATGAIVTMTEAYALEAYLTRASLVDLVALPVGFIGILGGFLLQRVNALHSEAQFCTISLIDHLREAREDVSRDTVVALIENRHALPAEQRDHARRLYLARLSVIRPGELLVMWSLGLFCAVAITLFRSPNIIGDALAVITSASLAYILLHLTFDSRVRLERMINDMLSDNLHTELSKQNRWSLVVIAIVGAALLALSHLGHVTAPT